MAITLQIPTEQNYTQSLTFTENGFSRFKNLVYKTGKDTIDSWILEVTEENVILYKSASFDPKSYSGPNYVMSREDAKQAIKDKNQKETICLDDPIRFGKYNGSSWTNLPYDYLLWLEENLKKDHKDLPYVKAAIAFQKLDL